MSNMTNSELDEKIEEVSKRRMEIVSRLYFRNNAPTEFRDARDRRGNYVGREPVPRPAIEVNDAADLANLTAELCELFATRNSKIRDKGDPEKADRRKRIQAAQERRDARLAKIATTA